MLIVYSAKTISSDKTFGVHAKLYAKEGRKYWKRLALEYMPYIGLEGVVMGVESEGSPSLLA